MTKILAALIGAIAAFAISVFLVYLIFPVRGPSEGPRGLGQGILILLLAVPVILAGAAGGWRTVDYAKSGHAASALKAVAISAATVVAMVLLTALSFTQHGKFSPANARARAKWAQQITGIEERDGIALARRLDAATRRPFGGKVSDAITTQSLSLPMNAWYDLGADSLAALGSYVRADKGWRWTIVRDRYPPRFLVFPDPSLRWKGPVFDVQPYLVVRRDSVDAPAHVARTMLPAFEEVHRCLVDAARQGRRDGSWNGRAETIVSFFANLKTVAACPNLNSPRESPYRSDAVTMEMSAGTRVFPAFSVVQIAAAPDGTGDPPFELTFANGGNSWFMVDGKGAWHMRNGGFPTADDRPPPKCFFDVALACDDSLVDNWRP
jgi:hypothetical protein